MCTQQGRRLQPPSPGPLQPRTCAQCAASAPTGPAPQMATTSPLPTNPSSHACLRGAPQQGDVMPETTTAAAAFRACTSNVLRAPSHCYMCLCFSESADVCQEVCSKLAPVLKLCFRYHPATSKSAGLSITHYRLHKRLNLVCFVISSQIPIINRCQPHF